MAADLHIHVVKNVTEADFRVFFASTEGSKWSPLTRFWQRHSEGEITCDTFSVEWQKVLGETDRLEGKSKSKGEDTKKWSKVYKKFATETPYIWIGEVSWLKADLLADDETFIPNTVGTIDELIGEDWPVLDDELIKNILQAFELENKARCLLAEVAEVSQFLEEHRGEKVFTISW